MARPASDSSGTKTAPQRGARKPAAPRQRGQRSSNATRTHPAYPVGSGAVPAEDLGVAKLGFGFLASLIALLALAWSVDWQRLSLPFGGAGVPANAAIEALGTPAPAPNPSFDAAALFTPPEAEDPLAPELWGPAAELLRSAGTDEGWTALCSHFAAAAGGDRTAEPLAGALACSDDPGLLPLQRLAALVLETKAQLALWLRHAPGGSRAAVEARLGEVRLRCSSLPEATSEERVRSSCEAALALPLAPPDESEAVAALDSAYASLAEVIAERDPDIETTPAFPGAASAP